MNQIPIHYLFNQDCFRANFHCDYCSKFPSIESLSTSLGKLLKIMNLYDDVLKLRIIRYFFLILKTVFQVNLFFIVERKVFFENQNVAAFSGRKNGCYRM